MKSNKKSICKIISISVMTVLSLISFFILPDNIAVQWNGTQASTYGSKWFIFLPVAIGILLIPIMNYFENKFMDFSTIIFFTLLIVLFTCQIYMIVFSFYPNIKIPVSVPIILEAILGVIVCAIYEIKILKKESKRCKK